MIKPTIGRVMWFWPVASERGAQPYAALVTYVHDDNMVNLASFNTDGMLFPAIAVAIVQDGSPYVAGDLPYAEWMPYQKGQAAKSEALEATLLSAADHPAGTVGEPAAAPAVLTENDPAVPAATASADAADKRHTVSGSDAADDDDLPAAGSSTL